MIYLRFFICLRFSSAGCGEVWYLSDISRVMNVSCKIAYFARYSTRYGRTVHIMSSCNPILMTRLTKTVNYSSKVRLVPYQLHWRYFHNLNMIQHASTILKIPLFLSIYSIIQPFARVPQQYQYRAYSMQCFVHNSFHQPPPPQLYASKWMTKRWVPYHYVAAGLQIYSRSFQTLQTGSMTRTVA